MTAPPPAPITSLANPRVKAAVRLRERHVREATGLTLVDGARELLHALDAGVAVEEAFVCRDLVRTADAEAALGRLESAAARIAEVSPAVLGKVAFGNRSDGLVAVVRPPERGLSDLALPTVPLVVVVQAVEKPGNLGAILRTADGAGVDALVAADPLTDLFNPNAIRASLGAIFRLPVAAATSDATLGWLADRSIRPIAARVDGPAVYTDIDLRGPIAIVLGSEATGLSSAWDDPRVTPVRIPMHGTADSLNVSVAAAVLLYEAVRQRA
ncbi:MAG TPA: TrmH family RNA methyltransferase [Candidatus Limnocylindrales bacterium]|nr:TrmH family RNA methyltransferase [Candidatus Limnocylindrales bacterium]